MGLKRAALVLCLAIVILALLVRCQPVPKNDTVTPSANGNETKPEKGEPKKAKKECYTVCKKACKAYCKAKLKKDGKDGGESAPKGPYAFELPEGQDYKMCKDKYCKTYCKKYCKY